MLSITTDATWPSGVLSECCTSRSISSAILLMHTCGPSESTLISSRSDLISAVSMRVATTRSWMPLTFMPGQVNLTLATMSYHSASSWNAQAMGGQQPTAPRPQDIYLTAYASAVMLSSSLTAPSLLLQLTSTSSASCPLFRSNSHGSSNRDNIHLLPPPAPAEGQPPPKPFKGGPLLHIILNESHHIPSHTPLALMDVNHSPHPCDFSVITRPCYKFLPFSCLLPYHCSTTSLLLLCSPTWGDRLPLTRLPILLLLFDLSSLVSYLVTGLYLFLIISLMVIMFPQHSTQFYDLLLK